MPSYNDTFKISIILIEPFLERKKYINHIERIYLNNNKKRKTKKRILFRVLQYFDNFMVFLFNYKIKKSIAELL